MAIELRQLRKSFSAPDGSVLRVVDIPQFTLNDQEQVALIGSSGSGKTTLLHLIAGILAADAGEIVFGLEDEIAESGEFSVERLRHVSTLTHKQPLAVSN